MDMTEFEQDLRDETILNALAEYHDARSKFNEALERQVDIELPQRPDLDSMGGAL